MPRWLAGLIGCGTLLAVALACVVVSGGLYYLYRLPAAPVPPPAPYVPPPPAVPTPVPTPIPGDPPAAPADSLKYDETGCQSGNLAACMVAGQTEFPAVYLRWVQAQEKTVFQVIPLIQQQAAAAGARTADRWSTYNVDAVYPTLVWCPAGNCEFPPDSAFPLLNIGSPDDDWTVAVVQAHLPADPPAGQTNVVCPAADCWSVLLH